MVNSELCKMRLVIALPLYGKCPSTCLEIVVQTVPRPRRCWAGGFIFFSAATLSVPWCASHLVTVDAAILWPKSCPPELYSSGGDRQLSIRVAAMVSGGDMGQEAMGGRRRGRE